MKKIIRIFDSVLAVFCAVIFAFIGAGSFVMPDEIIRYENDSSSLSALYSYSYNENEKNVILQTNSSVNETIKLLNIVPVKGVRVTSKSSDTVFVSGEAFGIKLYTDGVIVVGTQGVEASNGKKINPAERAGIEVGDIIISVNDSKVYSANEVTEILNDNNGKPYKIKLKRDGRYKIFSIYPVFSFREGCYKAGMWVRDSTAGIGTITFFNDNNNTFAALGHQVNDIDTNKLIPLLKGEAVSTRVTGVQKATANEAGSLICEFDSNVIGSLRENSVCGLYGTYNNVSENAKPYKVASMQEVKKGNAEIISTIDGGIPKKYSIDIMHINYNMGNSQKDIVFKVTDKTLLEKTGGIVQGMSGSPIIQNGKLVGAVTHVIVSNPEKGYGVFAQTMLEKTYNLK